MGLNWMTFGFVVSSQLYPFIHNGINKGATHRAESFIILIHFYCSSRSQTNANHFVNIWWILLEILSEWMSLANNYYSLFLNCVQPKTIINIIFSRHSFHLQNILCALFFALFRCAAAKTYTHRKLKNKLHCAHCS